MFRRILFIRLQILQSVRAYTIRTAKSSILLLPILFIPFSALAQWTHEGVPLVIDSVEVSIGHIEIFPDSEGGAWVVYERWSYNPTPTICVQRFNSDGYRQFGDLGVQVTEDSLEHRNFMMGAFPTADDGVMIGFWNPSINVQTEIDIYAQKINSDGEREYGDEARVVSRRGNK